jgi:DNA-binding SARP family transcriptional activator
MTVLRITLFGELQIARDDVPLTSHVTHTTQALLAYLLLQPRRAQPREVLADVLWSERSQEQARSCLSTALWRLRRILEPEGTPAGTYLIAQPSGEVSFNWQSAHWLDMAAFENKARQGLARPYEILTVEEAHQLEEAVQLYIGDLLEGFYADWALRERERLRSLYLNTLAHLMRFYQRQALFEKGLLYGQKILDIDPLREEVHRDMMRLYAANGQRPLAIRQYQLCCDLLARELGIAPMDETQSLYAHLIAEQPAVPAIDHLSDPSQVVQTLQQLQLTSRHLERAHLQIQNAIRVIERIGRLVE